MGRRGALAMRPPNARAITHASRSPGRCSSTAEATARNTSGYPVRAVASTRVAALSPPRVVLISSRTVLIGNVSVREPPLPVTCNARERPVGVRPNASSRRVYAVRGSPSMATMRSPTANPACAATPLGFTDVITARCADGRNSHSKPRAFADSCVRM
jgi:hypothetical protein